MSFLSLLTHRCTIERSTRTNVDGVMRPTWSTLATDVRCRIQEGAGMVRSTPGGQGLEYDAIAFFLTTQDIRPRGSDDQSDRIIQTRPATSITYMVQLVVDESGEGHHLVGYLTRVPSGTTTTTTTTTTPAPEP